MRHSKIAGLVRPCVVALAVFSASLPANAKGCGNDGAGFGPWLESFKGRAAGDGISAGTISKSLGGVGYDRNVIRLDRSQRSFKLSFEQFYARRVSGALINRGRSLMNTHRGTLNAIEKRYGVPGEVLISIWGLETNYGSDRGQGIPIVQALATLSYDCRRSDFFEPQLLAALQIIDRGDLSPAQMRGGWAGEIGQTQFLPLAYVQYAVDFDGNGRRDLINSVPDILASTANFLKSVMMRVGTVMESSTRRAPERS